MSKSDNNSYGQILKSSVLIGGAQILNTAFRIIRSKALAVILGPSGVGLFGLYDSIAQLTRSIAGLGINSSGVRQIAESVGSGDTRRLAKTVITVRRVALLSGAVGAAVLIIFSPAVSRMTFGNESHAGWIMLLALAVLFNDVSDGQSAVLQGMRKIGDLAKLNVLGAFYGTVLSIPIVYEYREDGVVPSLVMVAVMSILTSWWYARKIEVESVAVTLREFWQETGELVKLGVVFMASWLMPLAVAYWVRILVLHKFDLTSAGYYQSAWSLGGLYFSYILQAMGADFFPRLTAVAADNLECNRLVNEQAEVGMLMAVPGVMATLTLAPVVISVFYTATFFPAVEILRWICLGMVLRVVSAPLGMILIAKGNRNLYFWTELLSNLASVGLIWLAVQLFGLDGTGIGFFAVFVVYGVAIYLLVRRVSDFRWSAANRKLALVFMPLVSVLFVTKYFLPRWVELVLGAAITTFTGYYSLKILCTLIPLERFPKLGKKLLRLFRLTPSKLDV